MTRSERLAMCEVETWPESLQTEFRRLRAKGSSINMAHILVSRQAPGTATDDEFLRSEYTLAQRCDDPAQRVSIVTKARRAGIHVDEGCRYEPGLGGGPTDPNCWFSRGTGRGELQKRLNAQGADNVHSLPLGLKPPTPHNKPPKPVPALAPNLVKEIEGHMIAKDPALALTDRRELRERIVATHGSNNRKG